MLTAKQKSDLLNQVVDLLEQADALQQQALGDSDVCFDNHTRIQDLISDFEDDIQSIRFAEAQDKDYLDSDAHLGQVE